MTEKSVQHPHVQTPLVDKMYFIDDATYDDAPWLWGNAHDTNRRERFKRVERSGGACDGDPWHFDGRNASCLYLYLTLTLYF